VNEGFINISASPNGVQNTDKYPNYVNINKKRTVHKLVRIESCQICLPLSFHQTHTESLSFTHPNKSLEFSQTKRTANATASLRTKNEQEKAIFFDSSTFTIYFKTIANYPISVKTQENS